MTELLPCPFCGCDKIEIFHDHENAVGPHLAGYYIHHPLWKTHPETWGCWLNFGGKFDTPELAAEAWNKRTSAESAEALRYATSFLESYVHKYCNPIPEWKPLPDLVGVLTQIDNASTVTGDILKRAEAAEARLAEAVDVWAAMSGDDIVSIWLTEENANKVLAGYQRSKPNGKWHVSSFRLVGRTGIDP